MNELSHEMNYDQDKTSVVHGVRGKLSEFSENMTDSLVLSNDRQQTYSLIKNVINSRFIETDMKSKVLDEFQEKTPYVKYSASSVSVSSLKTDRTGVKYDTDLNCMLKSSSSNPNEEMTAWENWFVKKQAIERTKALKKVKDIEFKETVKRMKMKATEDCMKHWLGKKELEIQKKKENKEAKVEKIIGSIRSSELWIIRKHGQEEVDHFQKKCTKKKFEEEKKQKAEMNENAVRRLIERSKFKLSLPKLSYAYGGGCTISFYDMTRPPPPTFFNSKPWNNTCSSL